VASWLVALYRAVQVLRGHRQAQEAPLIFC